MQDIVRCENGSAAAPTSVRHNRHGAELPKVIVEGHGGLHAKTGHHDAAGAVSKAPAFVAIVSIHFPRCVNVGGSYPFHPGNFARQQHRRDRLRAVELTPPFQKCEQLVQHVIRGYERLRVLLQPRSLV